MHRAEQAVKEPDQSLPALNNPRVISHVQRQLGTAASLCTVHPPQPLERILVQLKLLAPAGEVWREGGVGHQALQRGLVQRLAQRRRAVRQRHCTVRGW